MTENQLEEMQMMEEVELENCHAVYDIATYKNGTVYATIKKYIAEENEIFKQVANVNFTLNELHELTQVLEILFF